MAGERCKFTVPLVHTIMAWGGGRMVMTGVWRWLAGWLGGWLVLLLLQGVGWLVSCSGRGKAVMVVVFGGTFGNGERDFL